MVRWVARVVHSGEDGIFRVLCTMNVVDEHDPGRLPQRTNRLMFVFATAPEPGLEPALQLSHEPASELLLKLRREMASPVERVV